jgi:hypothetical protein
MSKRAKIAAAASSVRRNWLKAQPSNLVEYLERLQALARSDDPQVALAALEILVPLDHRREAT